MTDAARALYRALMSQDMHSIGPDGKPYVVHTIAAAMRETEAEGLEEAAKIAESKYNHRDPKQYASYRAGDWTLDYEAAGDAIASAIRTQAAARRAAGAAGGAMMEEGNHPVQTHRQYNKQGEVSRLVTLRAYEVYCKVYAPQEALVTGSCRGGFSVGELIAFLYAHSFPENEWDKRSQEAFHNMKYL